MGVGVEGWTPAHAGEPAAWTRTFCSTRVDPRSRGGADVSRARARDELGGPPLTRGSQEHTLIVRGDRGWTPAHAGEPRRGSSSRGGPRVDPRSRGGALAQPRVVEVAKGGPPLTRGSRVQVAILLPRLGWTPAHAGEPPPPPRSRRRCGVDPRSRGGAENVLRDALGTAGGPPLTRGSPVYRDGIGLAHGWTPAHAGEPGGAHASARLQGVDPRSRGGAASSTSAGSKARGGPPLTRGSPSSRSALLCSRGWTPAHAGEPSKLELLAHCQQVDPRSRGGAFDAMGNATPIQGGPPLTRGSRAHESECLSTFRWTPAHAGEPRAPRPMRASVGVDPRSRGGASASYARLWSKVGGPPLTRGSRDDTGPRAESRGWTPAHAGEPERREPTVIVGQVDPRSRGGARREVTRRDVERGGPPLTRGSRRARLLPHVRPGWTPAHAGEPLRTSSISSGCGVDPRSRGGAWRFDWIGVAVTGGPPLTRGSLNGTLEGRIYDGWTPAHAGEPSAAAVCAAAMRVDPRSRGGARERTDRAVEVRGGPPLTRGSRRRVQQSAHVHGWTPAHAGEPSTDANKLRADEVDPRSRGGAVGGTSALARHVGGPPLTRGSHRRRGGECSGERWTPAHAGEPLGA